MKKGSPLSVLRFRDFRLLWIGLLVSQVGSQMQIVGINWHMYALTGSAVNLGLLGFVGFVSIFIFSLLGGPVADRYDRKNIMLISQGILGVSAFVLALATVTGAISPLLIYAALFVNGAMTSFDTPARQAIMPSLVPKDYFIRAVSFNTMMFQLAIILGRSLAGFVIAGFGLSAIYFFNALTFVVAIVAIWQISTRAVTREKRAEISLSAIKEGIVFVRNTPMIYATMLLDFIATFFSSAIVLMPIFMKDILHAHVVWLGFLYAAPAIGGVIAGLVMSWYHTIRKQGKLLLGGVILYGAATVGFGLSQSVLLSLLFLLLIGAGDMISTIIRNTIRQLVTPDHLRGRMVAINMIFFMGGPQLGETEAGFLAAVVGAPLSVVVGGIATVVATGITAQKVPQLAEYEGSEVAI